MKKFLGVIVVVMALLISSIAFAIDVDDSDIPLSVCAGQWGFLDASGELDDFTWSTNSWGNTFSTQKDWSPNQAGLQIRSNLQGLYKVIVRFQMSPSDIAKFKTTFNGTSTRIPSALEVDILDKNSILGEAGVDDFSIVSSNVPSEAILKKDVSASDSKNQLSAIIMRPDKLKANTLYEIVFQPDGSVVEGLSGLFRMNWQFSINYKWITAMKNNSSSQCDLMAVIDYLKDEVDDGNHSSGFNLVNSNYSASIPVEAQSGWYYFIASETDISVKARITVYNGIIRDVVCWDDDIDLGDSNHDESGPDFCSTNGNNLFMNPLGSHYPLSNGSGNNTDQDPQIVTEGNHTHVIALSYRCSKEIGGPILCWEVGGDTNCWDAYEWYQFNGTVSQVADHHNDSNWITNLSRDYTCNEVYSSGSSGNSGGGNNGGSSSQTPTTGADANVKSARASLQSDSQYKKTLHVQPQQEVKFKVTVNNKGDENFTQAFIHYYLDTGTKTLQGDGSEWIGEDDIGTLKPRQKVTDKLQHIHAPTQDGAYYLYACIWSESDQQDDTQWDNNCSNRRREYVKLIVQSVPMTDLPGTDTDGYATSSCGQAGYTIKECMVLLNIIFIKPNP